MLQSHMVASPPQHRVQLFTIFHDDKLILLHRNVCNAADLAFRNTRVDISQRSVRSQYAIQPGYQHHGFVDPNNEVDSRWMSGDTDLE